MMSASAICQMSREIAEEAAEEARAPFIVDIHDIEEFQAGRMRRIRIPNFGDYVPAGWERVGNDYDDWFFCDKTGGPKDGPALTIDEFVARLAANVREHPEYGYAIVEEGQFQLYVAAFRPADTEGA